MLIALREAATLLGRTERTLRDQLKRGEIRGKKENGRWWIEREVAVDSRKNKSDLPRSLASVVGNLLSES